MTWPSKDFWFVTHTAAADLSAAYANGDLGYVHGYATALDLVAEYSSHHEAFTTAAHYLLNPPPAGIAALVEWAKGGVR